MIVWTLHGQGVSDRLTETPAQTLQSKHLRRLWVRAAYGVSEEVVLRALTVFSTAIMTFLAGGYASLVYRTAS